MKEVIDAYKEINFIKLQIKKKNQDIENERAKLTEKFIPHLVEAYKKWEASIGEKMMIVDFLEDMCFKVTLESIDGVNCRVKENEHNYHRFSLEPDKEEYNTSVFTLPMFFYEEIKDKFNLKEWK
jgi:hypothetical protein